MPVSESQIVLEGLRKLPGGPELLRLAENRDDVELVGGAVRDLLLRRMPRELDVVVTDAAPFARDLAFSLGLHVRDSLKESPDATLYERFGTAIVEWDGAQIDIATRRTESYPAPGALPDVRDGSPEEDLARRDFTVNAIAVCLGGPERGKLRVVPRALDDLAHGLLRVLHEQSFIDDPTRLFRLARYEARLGFEVEDRTADLAARALNDRALDTISGARIGAELRLGLAEDDAVVVLAAMDDLGLLTALHPRLRFDRQLIGRALELLPDDGRCDLLLVAALTLPLVLRAGDDPDVELRAFLDRLEFPAGDRDRILGAARAGARLSHELGVALVGSRLRAVVGNAPPEGVALAGAQGDADTARSWLKDIRHVRLQIDGDDLIAAGVPEGPEIGHRLEATLRRKLDGELADGREAELAAALETEAEA